MPKLQTIYLCSRCDAQSPKWLGRCPECGAWGTLEQEIRKESKETEEIKAGKVVDFAKVRGEDFPRLKTGLGEFDRVLGGGVVPGSLVLIGGEPGIGKSTLVLQIAEKVSSVKANKILYVSGEESAQQIKMRMDRLSVNPSFLKFLGETSIETIKATIEEEKPVLVIIDSIQTMSSLEVPSEAGSVNQVRVSTVKLLETAKKSHIPIFIIGHVTKEGLVAGPKTLEHLVDTVLYLEGDRYHAYRLLRCQKNRFGATDEVGVFDMQEKGLTEVKNPSAAFLASRETSVAGSAITCIMEGTRPFLVEIQALVTRTSFGYPQRRASGFDFNRLQLLIAVLQRRAGLHLTNQDVQLNVVGGLEAKEPAVDLAVCLAIASALKEKILDSEMVAFGEVGLGGEVRPVGQAQKRILEAEKLGFKKIMMSEGKLKSQKSKVKIIEVKNVVQAINIALK